MARPTKKAWQIQSCVLAPRGSRVWSPRLFEMIWFGCIPVPCCKLLIWRYLEISGDGTAISMFLKSVSSCGNCVLRRLGRSVFEEYTWIFIVSAIIFVITDMKTDMMKLGTTALVSASKTWGDYFFRAAWLHSIWLTCRLLTDNEIRSAVPNMTFDDWYLNWVSTWLWRGDGNQLLQSIRGTPMKDMSSGRKIKHQFHQKKP